MSRQPITPEIRQWIVEQHAAGFDNETLLDAMRASGWDYGSAVQALADTLRPTTPTPILTIAEPATAPVVAAAAARPAATAKVGRMPEPDLSGSPVDIDLGDRRVRVLMALSTPRIVMFGGFLSDEECDELIELSRERLERSRTVDRAGGGSEVNAARSSSGMFFGRGENALCERIEQRIARLVRWPVKNGEGLQILRYQPGAEYKPHHDYFDPDQVDIGTILARGGQRVGTLVMYLQTTPRGGATIFPDIGLEVPPVKGNAVFFSYDRPHPDTLCLHGGAPVLEGEKWIATKWMREREFT